MDKYRVSPGQSSDVYNPVLVATRIKLCTFSLVCSLFENLGISSGK